MTQTSQEQTAFIAALKPYFVYELIDPRDNSVFYVGKGSGKRDEDHKAGDKDKKQKRIHNIEAAGYEVKRVIIGRYDTEDEAFAVETILIKWVYGYDNLTNIDPGKYHAVVRPKYQKDEANYTVISGIDREKRIDINTGEYTAEQKQKLDDNKIFEKLEGVAQYLASHLADVAAVSTPNLDRPQDPHLKITDFSENIILSLKLSLTGKDCTLAYLPVGSDKNEAQRFKAAMQEAFGNSVSLSKGNIFNSFYMLERDEKGAIIKHHHADFDSIKLLVQRAITRVLTEQ